AVEPLPEREKEAALVADGELADVEDAGQVAAVLVAEDEVGHEGAGGRLEGGVAVLPAEDVHRQPRLGAVAAGADAVPVALRVDRDPRYASVVHLLGEYDRSVALAAALLGQDAAGVGSGVERQLERRADVKHGCHRQPPSSASPGQLPLCVPSFSACARSIQR